MAKRIEEVTPDFTFDALTDITPEDIREMGAKAVAVDLDGTATYVGSFNISARVRTWAYMMRSAGIPVIIVSNTLTFRAVHLSKKMGNVPFVGFALKPDDRALRMASEKLGIDKEHIAMIGDKISTDIMAAKTSGAIGVKVNSLKREDFGGFKKISAILSAVI